MNLKIEDIDTRIWEDELEGFVPSEIHDAHTHVYRWTDSLAPEKEPASWRSMYCKTEGNIDDLRVVDATLMPGRNIVSRFVTAIPFTHCNFETSNAFIRQQVGDDPNSGAFALVSHETTDERLESMMMKEGFVGIKPYRFYSTTGDPVNCRIGDYLPERLIKVLNRTGGIVMLHIAKKQGIADPENLSDLERLTGLYPNVQWNLCHAARSYLPYFLEKNASRIRAIPNLWSDISSVCDSDALTALISILGADRVMYGSDDLSVSARRGKYITFGYAWVEMNEQNSPFHPDHCDPQMTYIRYESLRVLKRAAGNLCLSKEQIQNLFLGNARSLLSIDLLSVSPFAQANL
jgi:glutamate-1-semialdehyde 2,1-aminomutase